MVKIYVHVQCNHQYIHVTWGNINIRNKNKISVYEGYVYEKYTKKQTMFYNNAKISFKHFVVLLTASHKHNGYI